MQIHGILFDMGNTLLNFHEGPSDEEKDIEGIKRMSTFLQQWNPHVSPETVKTLFFDQWSEVFELRKKNGREYPIEPFLFPLLKRYAISLTLKQRIDLISSYFSAYADNITLSPNIPTVLKNLKEKKIKLGILSNVYAYEEIYIHLFRNLELDSFFDAYTFSYTNIVRKPDSRLFKIALKKLSLTPKNCIMVGDNYYADIIPAKNLGLTTVWLNSKGFQALDIPNPSEADFIIESMEDLLKII